ncbi:MAG: YggS family pyridoxal phosphate-dependent enzyme [Bacteroidota bacterium]
MAIRDNIERLKKQVPAGVTIIAVSKTHPVDLIMEAHTAGHRVFGENKAQEMQKKHEQLPADIEWHMIGHMQTNKVKYIAPFVRLIHSVDSLHLLQEIDKRAKQNERVIDCLLQIFIASEETKFGFSFDEAERLLASDELKSLEHVRITGLMGMATNTRDENRIRGEFHGLKGFFDHLRTAHPGLDILSMGMSSDYRIAIEEGSTMIRVGSLIFGSRSYE